MRKMAGIVLCGGRSSRMGQPKALLPLPGGEVCLQRVVRIVSGVVVPVVVVAAPGQELPELPANVLIARDEREYLGPLHGMWVGMKALPQGVDAVYVSSCDAPLLRPGFIRTVIAVLGEHEIAIPETGGYQQPLAAVYRLSVLPTIEQLLAENRLRPVFVTQGHRTSVLTTADFAQADPELESLRNMNTPADYEAVYNHLIQSKPSSTGD